MALTKAHNRMVAGSRVNVLDFGATGDGSTDDTAAIQAAIDEAYVSTNYDNKSVFLPTPSVAYKITGTLNLYQRVGFIGEDKWNCRILGSGQIVAIQNPRLVSNIWFDGGSIQNGSNKIHEAAWTSVDRANTAIILGPKDLSFQGGHAIIQECRFTSWGVAIEGQSCINSHIHDCYLSDGYHDVYFRATNSPLEFASTVKETKNYHAGAQGVGLGFYQNANGYQVVDISDSVYETLCRTETTLSYIDAPNIAVRAFGGNNVYFENNSATHPNAKAITTSLFSGQRMIFNGFNRCFTSGTTSAFWSLEDSEIISTLGSYDITIPANGRCYFRNVAFSAGLDASNLGEIWLQQCSATNILTNDNDLYCRNTSAEFRKFGATALIADRGSSDGVVQEWQSDGQWFGRMSVDTNRVSLESAGTMFIKQNDTTARTLFFDSGQFRPSTPDDGSLNLGSGSARWGTVFATTGTINTSDENEKQDIATLDSSEQAVATRLKGLIKKFKFRDAVESKGDGARIHVGVIAQDVKAAFEAEGLDAHHYGVFCSDTWTDDDGVEQTRLGVRYEELYGFIISTL